MKPLPPFHEFRIEILDGDIVHLVFDMPGRTMNVFSNRAIHESEAFADWLKDSGAKGVLVSSGKPTGFCAGADLGELAEAYAMIVAALAEKRSQVAADHFAPIGRAFRKLETSGIPVAFAINGLALGGGCEFALAGHARFLADTPSTALGLPESLVGLLPGGGGTQRLSRLIGLEASLPILLDGARLSPHEAVAAGAATKVVPAGEEIAAALDWLRSGPEPKQKWDKADWTDPSADNVRQRLARIRTERLAETRGHYPAITSILDCVEQGLPLPMDDGIKAELRIFADLIKRPEPRDMIATLFLGRQAYAKARKANALPASLDALKADVAAALSAEAEKIGRAQAEKDATEAGFVRPLPTVPAGAPVASLPDVSALSETGLWIERPTEPWQKNAARLLAAAARAAAPHRAGLDDASRQLADFSIVEELGFPAYLGGPFALLQSVGSAGIRKMAEV